MNDIETYLSYNLTYKDFYIENNKSLCNQNVEPEKLYISICKDVDIVLSSLNILPSKSGYLFWKDAVYLYVLCPKSKVSICNDIYPFIAQKHNTTITCIDRAMRRCFENVLYYASKNENNFICQYLKNTLLFPRNSEIIVKLVELICSEKFQNNKSKFAI